MTFIYGESKDELKKRHLSQEIKNRQNIDNINKNTKQSQTKNYQFNNIKNLENDKEYIKLKEEIDNGTNFIDYFLIIGISPEVFFDDKIYECSLDELNNKYKDQLQPKIISYFPQFEKKTIAFDDSIISHCFPNGFNIIKSNKIPKTEIF